MQKNGLTYSEPAFENILLCDPYIYGFIFMYHLGIPHYSEVHSFIYFIYNS